MLEADGPVAREDDAVALVEIARSPVSGYLQVLGARLDSEGIPSHIVNENCNRMGAPFADVAGGARLMVDSRLAVAAREIVDLLDRGAFALRDGEPVG